MTLDMSTPIKEVYMETELNVVLDNDELISLKNCGYLQDDELENKEAIINALHTGIADLVNFCELWRSNN